MTVFVVVDFATQTGYGPTSSKQSILDMPTAQFIQDEAGNTQLKMMKYLDTFPFSYYLIVQNIQELPNVLAGALRQWFAEVMDSGG
jgi:midasin